MSPATFQLSSYSINLWAIPVACAALTLASLSLKLFYQERLERTSLTLNLVTFFMLIWQFSFFFMYSSTNASVALWWAKAAYLGVPFIPAALYLFVITALDLYDKHKRLNAIIWALSLFSSILIVGTDLVVSKVKHFPWGYYPQYTSWSIMYLIPFVIVLGMSYHKLLLAYKQEVYSLKRRLRIRSFLLAFGIGGLSVVDYLPKFDLDIYPAGYMAILVCVVILNRTLAKYQLIDITPTFAAQGILDTMDEALIAIDAEGIIRLINHAATVMFGQSEKELLGRPYSVIFGEGALPVLDGSSSSDALYCYELSYAQPYDGRQILSMSASSMKDESGRVMATVCTVRNITEVKRIESELRDAHDILERKVEERTLALKSANERLSREIQERLLTEEALRKSEEMYRLLTDISPNAISVADPSGIILMLNRRALELYGYEDDAGVLGRSIFEWVAPEERQRAASAFETLLKVGIVTNIELSLLRKNGSSFFAVISASLLRGPHDDPQMVIIVTTDVTQKKLMEDERLKFQKLEAIGTLAGGIAHDFNNLLQGVFGYISIAKLNAADKDKTIAALEQAEKALDMSVTLTTQLLTFSKGGRPVKKKIPLQPVIENSVRFALSGSSADYRINLGTDLWHVEADEGQIGQVIQNIVLNADQAMPMGGTIVITAKNLEVSKKGIPHLPEEGKYVEISVQDNGTGISAEYLSKIFDPYFTTKAKGSGLGLATCYSIVRNHGGAIHVSSKVGRGTTFCVYLPAVEAEKEALRTPGPSPFVRRGKILLMDDEELIRDIAGDMIKALDHEVELAENGEEALGKYKAAMESGNPFDVVILDLTIRGGMGGRETIERLLEVNPRIKAIVSSGYSDDTLVSDYRNYGFSACLTKPYKLQELSDGLNNLLSK
jgi:PAS domain S-box-containing protein